MPAVAIGLLLKDVLESLFHAPVFAAGGLFVTAALLFSTRARRSRAAAAAGDGPRAPTLRQALLIGCGQAFAIVPGVSRSGTTIAVSLWLGLPRVEAARFSFLLSIPAICGALVLQLVDRPALETDAWPFVLAALVAFGVGLLALRWTALAVVQAHFWKFGFYCVAVGTAALIALT